MAGKFDEFKGNVKETVGDATDNESLQTEGKLDQVQGKGKEAVENTREGAEKVADRARDAVDPNR